jgi:5'-3' exonuclease
MGLPAGGTDGGYLHRDGKIDLSRLELLMRALGRAEDKIFVERHEKRAEKAGHYDSKRKRLEDHQGKLTAQQQCVVLPHSTHLVTLRITRSPRAHSLSCQRDALFCQAHSLLADPTFYDSLATSHANY